AESDLSGNPDDGAFSRGNNGEADIDSDLTIDFGFWKPMSVGNIVWLDNGAGGGTRNDGLINGTEEGIAGVTVILYQDLDGNGTPETPIRSDVTDSNGYYLFDGLTAGSYRIEIPASNFA